jgi:hypothetical protein
MILELAQWLKSIGSRADQNVKNGEKNPVRYTKTPHVQWNRTSEKN